MVEPRRHPPLPELIDALCAGKDLEREVASALFARIVDGALSELELTALLIALKAKGETPAEVAGAAEALRRSATPFDTGGLEVADSCGTGGDGAHTVNVSTAVALVAAEAGVPVAKHGNRSVSSQCGSADVLEHCGVKLDLKPAAAQRCLHELGISFLFAPHYHAGMRHAVPVRRALRVRTIFNLVGPLANPAQPTWQLLGVYDPRLCEPMARTLALLGCRAALVVHGDGLDELGLHAPATAAHLHQGRIELLTIDPSALGLSGCALDELRGGDAEANAAWLRQLLRGEGRRSHYETVALNAGALLWISGRSADLRGGVELAREVLAGGRAAQRLQRWAELTTELALESADGA